MGSDFDDQPKSVSEQSVPGKRAYSKPVLLRLGTFNDLTQTVGSLGNNDGGHQRGRRSTRA